MRLLSLFVLFGLVAFCVALPLAEEGGVDENVDNSVPIVPDTDVDADAAVAAVNTDGEDGDEDDDDDANTKTGDDNDNDDDDDDDDDMMGDEEEEEEKCSELPYEVMHTTEEFELRKYPSAKWACVNIEGLDVTKDPFEGWQNDYETAKDAAHALYRKMKDFIPKSYCNMLKGYFLGVNHGFVTIPKGLPKITKRTQVSEGVENLERCVWTGEEYMDKDLPQPGKEEVTIEETPVKYVYVRKLEECALSMSDWAKEKDTLVAALGDMTYVEDYFYQVKLYSHHHSDSKRKEVWVEVNEADINPEHLQPAQEETQEEETQEEGETQEEQ